MLYRKIDLWRRAPREANWTYCATTQQFKTCREAAAYFRALQVTPGMEVKASFSPAGRR